MKAEESILIERLKKGERTAFNELYGIFWAPLVNYAELIVGDENADDVVQEVFVRIWVGRDKLRNDGSLRGYLLRAVYRTALNVLRSKNYASSYRSQTKLQIEQQLCTYYDPDENEIIRNLYARQIADELDALAEMPRSIPYEPFRGAVEQRDLGAAEYQRFDRRESYQQRVAAITRQTGPSENVFAVDDLHLGTIKAVDELGAFPDSCVL